MKKKPNGRPVGKQPCPRCRKQGNDNSGDNLVVYDNNTGYCFACKYSTNKIGEPVPEPKTEPVKSTTFKRVVGDVKAIPSRKLNKAAMEKFNCQTVMKGGKAYYVFDYYDSKGNFIAQKVRSPDKKFKWIGDGTKVALYGMNLWKPGGKRLTITEGEFDATAVSQIQQNKWPVVSVPHGAASAEKAIRANIDWINSFDVVVFCFDNDEAGQKAAADCAVLLSPGKAHIAKLTLKDANEYIKEGLDQDLSTCLWQATPYRPDGIITVSELQERPDKDLVVYDYPWDDFTQNLYGRRGGELWIHTSGSGMGKSTILREMVVYDLETGNRPGVMFLEENAHQTVDAFISLKINKPVRRILAARAINAARKKLGKSAMNFDVKDDLTDAEYKKAKDELAATGLCLYDHFGSLDSETLISKMNYMVVGLGCNIIYLDHLSIVISGLESGNERKDIDVLMTNLRSFVERTGCRVEAVCHLTKPDGTPFEEGGQISLRDLRGSGSLYQLSDGVLAYERNQQDINHANFIAVRSLKSRFEGTTGVIAALQFSREDGRIRPADWNLDDEGNMCFSVRGSTPKPKAAAVTQTAGKKFNARPSKRSNVPDPGSDF